jgi:CHASE3 domain sensor protein
MHMLHHLILLILINGLGITLSIAGVILYSVSKSSQSMNNSNNNNASIVKV